ncbi:MAG: hypothetical protein WCP21_13955, partial [Armatimonadota bacterium]
MPVRSPDLNAHAERRARTVQAECLRWVLGESVRCYGECRPHRSLDLRSPNGSIQCSGKGEVRRQQILG